VPPPYHVKIDVDGLEHAIVAGMTNNLNSPELKSVLVEINGQLDEHKAILDQMEELGFHVDDRQKAASLRTEGFFAGSGKIIFWKDAASADRLGAKLSGQVPATIAYPGQRIAGLTAADAMEAVEAAIAAAAVQLIPTPYWYCEEIFPAAFYEEMQVRWPANSLFTPIRDIGWVTGEENAESNRGFLHFGGDGMNALPDDLRKFWSAIADGRTR
jgi:hypothetical protein